MQYPIIDNLIYAYQRNGWTGLELTYGKNLMPINEVQGITWAFDWMTMVPGFSDFINSLENGDYTLSYDFEITSVSDRYTSDTAYAYAGSVFIVPLNARNPYFTIYRQDAINHYSNHNKLTFTKNGDILIFYSYGLGRNDAVDGAPNGALGSAQFYNIQIEKGTEETPYEPYAPPTIDIANRLKLPLPHYFPHPVIDALISAADGQHTEEEKEILRHYLTPLGIGGI